MRFIDEQAFLLGPGDYQEKPWKNGGGTTREILAHPSDTEDFDWRLSIADIAADGPFSAFPGIARTIVLLDGEGMRLAIDDDVHEVRIPFAPLDFDGAAKTDCTLLNGPVTDFNIMSARNRVRHDWRLVDCFPFAAPRTPADALVVFALRGGLEAGLTRCGKIDMPEHSTLLLASPRRLQQLDTTDKAARALLVRFRRLSARE